MRSTVFAAIQQLGRSLMLPIAVLPIAGLLLRLGQPDLLDIAFVSAAGDAIFANLGLIFAIGVGIGFAKDNHGAAGLAGVVAYLIAANAAQPMIDAPAELVAGLDAESAARAVSDYRQAAIAKLGVPLGIICGILAGLLFNRYANIKLPDFLAFFGGRRFVPIAAGSVALILGLLFGEYWHYAESGIDGASRAVVGADEVGLFVYGALNRLLIVTGLHHILNNIAWFVVGDFEGATGDLRRFFAGDPQAGAFMAGFFPVMMFGMPAACLAMYRAAAPERRKQVGGLYLSMALTSALTGITEPIEFTFMFLAPLLYLVHAVLTGASMVLMDLLNVKLGFGFSAGLIDYVLNYGIATNPLWVLPVGIAYFAIYYATFTFVIRRFNLATPGREQADVATSTSVPVGGSEEANAWLAALGGPHNVTELGACTTRLRLVLGDSNAVDEIAIKALGARGIIRPTAETMQVIVGPKAELLASDIGGIMGEVTSSASERQAMPQAPGVDEQRAIFAAALGGEDNIVELVRAPGRLVAQLRDPSKFSSARLPENEPVLHTQLIGERSLHILLGS
ncbi:MAG: N-acetylglucosamine-specific PTS transporter subunit IIBC [Pseudomonadota bacterium]